MSGHVIYACACLNIKLHLANKYLLDNHLNDRAECFVRLDDPSVEGRQFELGMGGVQAEYNTLMATRLIGNSLSWMTVSCLNCSTGNVYSIQRATNTNERFTETYPVDIHSLYRTGDRVIIHDNTVYGSDIDKIKQRQNYSHNFHIVLNTDTAVLQKKNAEFDDNSNSSNNIPGDLYSQHGQLRQILEKTLKQMQQSTEQRIKQFQQDQLQQLERASTQAKCDRNFLWQKILEASRTVNEEKQLRKRLSDPEHQLAEIGGHVRFAEQQQQAPSSSTASSYNATRPIVQHHQQQQPISTSSFITPASLRKSSFALDERVITSSWKNTSHLHHQGLGGGLGQDNDSKDVDSHDATLSDRDNTDDDHEDDGSDDGLFDLDEEIDNEEENEDITQESSNGGDKHHQQQATESNNHNNTHTTATATSSMSASYQGSSFDWSKKRKSNTKYLTTYEEDDDEEPESRTRRLQDRGNDTLSTSVSAYATSMPIAISHNNDSSFSDAMKTMANNEKSKAVNPADQDPTINNSSATATSSSMQKNDAQQNNKEYTIPTGSSLVSRTQAYDQFSLADQEASKLFPTAYLERRRKSVAATGATPRPQLDSLIGQSLDTRQRRRSPSITATAARNNHSSYNNNNNTSSSNSFIASTTTDQYLSRQQQQQQQHHESNSDDEHQVGPMVPPHILAASTYTDETEELFGAVPRSNTWRKTYD